MNLVYLLNPNYPYYHPESHPGREDYACEQREKFAKEQGGERTISTEDRGDEPRDD